MRLYNKRTHEYAKLIAEGDTYYKVEYERDYLVCIAPKIYFEVVEELEDVR